MPSAPKPITSPPSVPGQPWDATAPGSGGSQTQSETVYDATGGAHAGDPWPKVADGGAADSSGAVSGGWPGDGTSDGRAWKQT
jgi:hypothetical protein